MSRRESRYGFRWQRVGEASHPGPPKLVLISSSQGSAPATVPASSGAIRHAHMGVSEDVVPTQWESGAEFSFPSRASGLLSSERELEMEFVEGLDNNFVVAMDVDDEERHSVSPSLLDDLERELDPTVLDGGSPTLSIDQDDSERDDADSEFSEAGPAEELDHDLPVPEHRPSVAAMRAGLRFLDDVDLCETFAQRAAVMKNIPKFLWGSFRVALRLPLEEISIGSTQNDWVRQVRGWKMFLVLPRLLLHRPPRGKVGREKLVSRFLKFSAGQWADLFRASQQCTEQAATISRRARRRGGQQGFEKRVARAMQLVQLGELSGGRQALEGADLAPGSDATLRALRKAKPTSRARSSNPCTPSIRVGREPLWQELAVSQERCEWWPVRHDVGASQTTLGAPTRHTSVVSGR